MAEKVRQLTIGKRLRIALGRTGIKRGKTGVHDPARETRRNAESKNLLLRIECEGKMKLAQN